MSYPVSAGTTSMSGTYIPEIWAGKLQVKFYEATVFAAISNTDYEGTISAHGDKVLIRTVPDITINDYNINQKLDYERPEGSKVELLIDQGKYYAFSINAVEKKQSDIDYMERWSDDAGQQMKISIDTSILSYLVGEAHASNKGTSAGAISGNINLGAISGSAVTITKANAVDKLVEMGQVLQEQNVPETERAIVVPAWWATRLKTSDLKDASLTGDGTSTLRNGRIGKIDKFTVYESNNLYTSTDNDSDTAWYCFACHKSALTFASQLVENEMIPNPDDFGQLIRGLQVYGRKVIKPEALVEIVAKPGSL